MTKHHDHEMEHATALAALNLRTQALSREREAAVTHAHCMESDLRNMEHALQDWRTVRQHTGLTPHLLFSNNLKLRWNLASLAS